MSTGRWMHPFEGVYPMKLIWLPGYKDIASRVTIATPPVHGFSVYIVNGDILTYDLSQQAGHHYHSEVSPERNPAMITTWRLTRRRE